MYKILFERLGLSESDAHVYRALLSLKSATPAEVAKEANVPRELTYYILKKLAKDGLVRQDPEADKQRFELLLPEVFKKEMDEQKQELKIAQSELENLFSIVQRQLETTESSTSVKYYSGIEGIKQAYLDFLKGYEGKNQYGVINYHWKGDLEGYFLQKRLIYNVKLRMIIADTERGRRLASKDATEMRETRIVPTNGFPESTYITGIGNRIMFISQQDAPENMAMVIEHDLLQQAVHAMFELIWSTGSFLSNS